MIGYAAPVHLVSNLGGAQLGELGQDDVSKMLYTVWVSPESDFYPSVGGLLGIPEMYTK